MTNPSWNPSRSSSWTPSHRRLTDSLRAAVAPACACVLALGGLAVWTASGSAGRPPRIDVTDARLFLPAPGASRTAAFFRITNTGGVRDRLVEVTSSAVTGGISLSRHRMTGRGSAYPQAAESLPVPAGGTLAMSPFTSDVTVPVTAHWRAGDLVPFTLRFEHSGRVEAGAVVVRPGEG
ncbi:copper chaperone PCu(A)C [Streptomyces rugosispiralis]|uniref:Copper chaperone PCu(A)C n=1 Tax=Streptomyces rugosispiralis TaxID=2967341 RepID=A0ABT1USY7_9ACTN|nr:copper chaperone PCu(A)C [Streptomyces rugosispiralis]MCQ8187724.1 copper chaperone PCu(A)C [Streptomyces rugosispiralis]